MADIGRNTFLIRIDHRDVDSGEFAGCVINSPTGEKASFSTLSRMILLMDSMLDVDTDLALSPTAAQADMEIEILFRQNASWQGKLRFPKQKKEAVFRSVLELIVLIETAM